MRLHPKQLPDIAREILQLLTHDGDVEVEPSRIADAELDFTAIMREYLTNEGRVNQSTREALERRGYSYAQWAASPLAEFLGFQADSSDLRKVGDRLVDQLLASPFLKVLRAEPPLLRQKILIVFMKHVEDDSPLLGGKLSNR
jgi:uncharacterized protein